MNSVLLRRTARFTSRKLPFTTALRRSPIPHSQRRHHANTSLALDYFPQQAAHHGIPAMPLSDAERKTIYALASAPGRAGVAVIRVSGPNALQVYDSMLQGSSKLPKPWMMRRCTVLHPITREELDDGLYVFFKGTL
jgi:tRNA modification GTPase